MTTFKKVLNTGLIASTLSLALFAGSANAATMDHSSTAKAGYDGITLAQDFSDRSFSAFLNDGRDKK